MSLKKNFSRNRQNSLINNINYCSFSVLWLNCRDYNKKTEKGGKNGFFYGDGGDAEFGRVIEMVITCLWMMLRRKSGLRLRQRR